MAVIVRMPSALAGETEGAIQTWIAAAGQAIEVGDPLVEIETEKAVVEFTAETAGTVGRLLAEPGVTLAVGTPIAVILETGDGDDAIGAILAAEDGGGGGAQPSVTPEPAAPEPETAPELDPAPDAVPAQPAPNAQQPAVVQTSSAEPEAEAASDGARHDRRFASPIVRRLAREQGIDLASVSGTGPGGRVVRRDLERAIANPPVAAPATAPTSATAAVAPVAAEALLPKPAVGSYTDVPLTGMRRAIARRLTESKTTVPHFYVTAHCRVDELMALRAQVNAVGPRKVSLNDFIVKAAAGALRDVPAANAVWNGDSIRHFDTVDVAVAVAIDGGLLTPVVRGVESLSVGALSAQIGELAERARAGKLKQAELEGGSFSVSNLGMYGVDEFSAILNPPQSGILAVGAAKERAVVVDGQLAIGQVMTVTLSADHRVVDGAVAAEWMASFVKQIEAPLTLLVH